MALVKALEMHKSKTKKKKALIIVYKTLRVSVTRDTRHGGSVPVPIAVLVLLLGDSRGGCNRAIGSYWTRPAPQCEDFFTL